MPDSWQTNATIEQIASRIDAARSIVVLTHVKPDGDAIGASLALVRAVAANRRTSPSSVACPAEAWYTGPMPLFFNAVSRQTKARCFGATDELPAFDPELLVVVDTGSWSQLDNFADWVRPRAARTIVIDHHRNGDPDTATMRHIDTSAAAVCQTLGTLCARLTRVASPAHLDESIAEPLYLGLATDTGWFRHSNVTPAVMHLAADLIEAGTNHERLFQVVEQRDRPARLRLMARALASLQFEMNGICAVMSLRQQDFDETGAAPQDVGGFVDIPKSVEQVLVSCLLTETGPAHAPITKISMRSKGGPDPIDVNAVTVRLGGGGHVQAAGARLQCSLEEARRRMLEAFA
ncbi:MAG: bifunctional oligoribonuclease/PAP phosphatase NrnA [Leptolyngbya sp. PLA3]|nr:MAG: bifunctional oligoribonuclease/PAP phosphatase NrnA [Cyanobacteria bacterium CYA]MCE7968031.1 bifunctional oligoribonuclease/PAP phosphatase NrnA [Leptolyngbya sp. PL-A3]